MVFYLIPKQIIEKKELEINRFKGQGTIWPCQKKNYQSLNEKSKVLVEEVSKAHKVKLHFYTIMGGDSFIIPKGKNRDMVQGILVLRRIFRQLGKIY